MSRPADGLLAVQNEVWRTVPARDAKSESARRISAWLADHLDALAETGKVDHGSFRLAAAEVRAAGGVA